MTDTTETERSSASGATDAQPDLLAARRAAWEAGSITPTKCRPRRLASDDDLAAVQAEATARALRNWDKDELEDISGPRGGTSLANVLGVAIADVADDFGGKRQTPWIDYQEYLKSDRWREMRRRKLLRCGGICQRCYRSWRDYGFLDVHHLDYRHFGEEREADLIVLCRECHNVEHGVVR
jgi:HNH endonuclease